MTWRAAGQRDGSCLFRLGTRPLEGGVASGRGGGKIGKGLGNEPELRASRGLETLQLIAKLLNGWKAG